VVDVSGVFTVDRAHPRWNLVDFPQLLPVAAGESLAFTLTDSQGVSTRLPVRRRPV